MTKIYKNNKNKLQIKMKNYKNKTNSKYTKITLVGITTLQRTIWKMGIHFEIWKKIYITFNSTIKTKFLKR